MTDKNDFDFEDELTPDQKNPQHSGDTESLEGITESLEGHLSSSGTGFRETAEASDTEEFSNLEIL